MDSGQALIEYDLLSVYDLESGYEIEPGGEYHEMGSVIAESGELLSARVTFHLGGSVEDAVSEYRLIHVE